MQNFSGSYQASDVTFLLKPVSIISTDVLAKEQAIQSGKRHYSEMLSDEKTPDERYMNLFDRALAENSGRFAQDLARLASTLATRPGKEVVLVSLARAGTPVGVLLHRGLQFIGRQSVHYSISIIRDRGVDAVALDYIIAHHQDTDIVFIDGWTGKGAIADELRETIVDYNTSRGTAIDSSLVVVSDLAGVAGIASTSDDYLIPSAILNSIVSGLVSRTVLNDEYVGPGDFHACMFYEEKRGEDLSRYFVDTLTPIMLRHLCWHADDVCVWGDRERVSLKRASDNFIAAAMQRWNVTDRNRVKPGIGESTRALLRRVPERLILRDATASEVEHLVALAETHNVPIELDADLPYKAAVIIKTLGD
jgi:Phosphoribosyl transferase (PRTase)/PELOTA RNA binding domain